MAAKKWPCSHLLTLTRRLTSRAYFALQMNQEHRLKEASIRELISLSYQDLASESAAFTVSEVELSETIWRRPLSVSSYLVR